MRRLVAIILPALLALCATAATATPASDTLERIRQRQKIVIAHRLASIPFSYLDGDGRPVGYAIDICSNIVNALKRELKLPQLEVEYLPITPATRIGTIASGKADMECGSTTNTAERRKEVAFSIPYFVASAKAVVRKESGIRNWPDLRGRTIATTKGTTNARTLAERGAVRSLQLKLVEVDDHANGFALVERGDADAFAMDDVLLYGLVASSRHPEEFAVVGDALSIEPYAVMMRKGDPQFKRVVDGEIARLMQEGMLHAIYDKWFARPIPPQGIKLNMPMGPLLRDIVRYPSDRFE